MQWISKTEWCPADGFTLETEAMKTTLSNENTLVVAGPGAGKTELLAQRASFLLETNECRYPKKILAISFKKDAAENLKERVKLRCGETLAVRFESKTYDAFAKEIVDRFRESLDEVYRPLKTYRIAKEKDVKKAFVLSGMDSNISKRDFRTIFEKRLSINKLPLDQNMVDKIYIDTWNTLLKGDAGENFKSSLSFQMIARLAEFLIRSNLYIKKAIHGTYSHVFLDEFQDTTSIQYELIKTCFHESESIITAVGDSKQRIMLWAGARKSIFNDFHTDFQSQRRSLVMNHRSAPRLVEIQKLMYNKLNEDEIDLKTNDKWENDDGKAFLRIFDDHFEEAEILSNEIRNLISQGVELNEICVLVKQQVDVYGEEIINELSEFDIKARNEALYQDLLKENIVKTLVSLFKLALNDNSPDDWNYFYQILSDINGIDENSRSQILHDFINGLSKMINDLRLRLVISNKEEFSLLVDSKIDEISYEKFTAKFQEYQSKEYFEKLVDSFKRHVWDEYEETNDWIKAIDNFEGKNSIPIMTIHKSKGLEFDTIFFVGLEDSAFWNFKNQPDEDRCAFFVALSRAKRRIDFTFSKQRPTMFTDNQKHECINEFYEMFEENDIIEIIEY